MTESRSAASERGVRRCGGFFSLPSLGGELGGIWINAAWILNLGIIGFLLGVWMLNRVPLILALRPQGR